MEEGPEPVPGHDKPAARSGVKQVRRANAGNLSRTMSISERNFRLVLAIAILGCVSFLCLVFQRCEACLPLGGQAGSRLGWREHQGLDETSLERAKRYRAHAEEIRSAAADIKHPESRAALFRLAVTYERLAERLESESETPTDIDKDR